ncbi:citrate lyase subunit beta/citryl-CoA lyase [Roseibium hamelinense]|uniref:Citrate lyase subunit beta/citryl-CoA lyase n=1 Tax=Roseibium hamelinense TaxID=150831 RepID=A0A562SPA0_9HYPH|nr:CoA ester lyase [Roseibium hamelinense]MTI44048.1 CoA ester lyase [Roseibium hamelinense]TWI82744.1 citrate lyase subunit beta/citryl-CoA lyase [Roseibium hamelinense]
MTNAPKPRRSALYMPGSNARALEKAKTLDVDCLILDLEDAVAPDSKAKAREQIVSAVTEGGYGDREVIIRVNGADTPWGQEDLEAAVHANPDALLVPKVNSAADLEQVAQRLNVLGASPSLKVWAMMETPHAILNAAEIGACGHDARVRLSCFVMGTNDLAKETRAALAPGRAVMMPWLMTCVAAARSGGIDVLDGVYNAFNDLEGFEAECRQGVEMGMDGKTLVHPKQIEACHRTFSPSESEVLWARKINDIFDQPENADKGAIQVDGKMVERLHADMGKRVIAIADLIAARSRG